MKKKSFVKGAIILGLASIICKILGAIFRLPLTYLLGTEGVGIYQLAYPIFALFLVFTTSGIPVAISKIVSNELSKGNYKNTKIIFNQSIKIMLILGLVSAVVIVGFSGVIAKLQGNSNIKLCYFIISPAIIFGSIISAYRGYFQGHEIMKYSATSQIIEQLFKVVFGLFFTYIFLQFGIIYGVLGAFVGLTFSELIALIYLFVVYKRKNLKIDFNQNKEEVYVNKIARKIIIQEALPITLTAIVIPITAVIDSLIIIRLLSYTGFSSEIATSLYGIDSGIIASLINLPSVIAVSIGISLMPSISSSLALSNDKDVKFKSKLAIKLVWYLTLPCALIYFIFSKEICFFLYGNLNSQLFNQLNVASLMLRLSSFSIIYIALNQILTTVLQATNKSYFAFYTILIASIIKLVLTIVLVLNKQINIYGLIISDVICYSFACIINVIKLQKTMKLKFYFKEIALVPFVALLVLASILLLFKYLVFKTLNRVLIVLAIFSALSAYLIVIVLLKGFNLREIRKTKLLNFFKSKKY